MQSGIFFMPAGKPFANKPEFFCVPTGTLLCTDRNSFVHRSEFFCVPTGILLCTDRNSFVYRSEFFCVPTCHGKKNNLYTRVNKPERLSLLRRRREAGLRGRAGHGLRPAGCGENGGAYLSPQRQGYMEQFLEDRRGLYNRRKTSRTVRWNRSFPCRQKSVWGTGRASRCQAEHGAER